MPAKTRKQQRFFAIALHHPSKLRGKMPKMSKKKMREFTKLAVVFLLLMVGAASAARQRIYTNSVGNNPMSYVWSIKGTASDTSAAFSTRPVMTIFTWAADTTADDSVSLTLSLQANGSNGWLTFTTTTITAESTNAAWLITTSAVPSSDVYRLIVTGNAANSKASPVLGMFTFDSGNAED